MSEWISVKERLPEYGTPVLAFDRYESVRTKGKCIQVTRLKKWDKDWKPTRYGNSCDCIREPRYTHWMPLPEAPHE